METVGQIPPRYSEVENNPEMPESERMVAEIYADMREFKVSPVSLIQGGAITNYVRPDVLGAEQGRPFTIFEVASRVNQKLIYKAKVKEDTRCSATNEISFLSDIAPALQAEMPMEIRDGIRFPRVEASKSEVLPTALLMEKMEGVETGGVHEASPGVLTKNDLDNIIQFIKTFQSKGTAKIIQKFIDPGKLRKQKVIDTYLREIKNREPLLRPFLGDEYFEKIMGLLDEKREFLSGDDQVMAAGDINPSNMIKDPKGRLCFIDWERIKMTNSLAYDYTFLYATLFSDPELQAYFREQAVLANAENPDFPESLRCDYIFDRGSGELSHWLQQAKEASTEEERTKATKAVESFRQQLIDAIDKKGIWAEKTGEPVSNTV